MSAQRGWAADVGSLLGELGKNVAGVAARALHAAFGSDPYEILGYRGYGNSKRAYVYGRVIEKRDIGASGEHDSILKNLYNTYRRADSDPLPFARVKVEFGGSQVEMKADDEGFFGDWINTTDEPSAGWSDYSAELLPREGSPPRDPKTAPTPVKGKGEVLVPMTSARFGVISDLDDTVIQSRVSNFLVAARTVMLGNARTRLPFPGVAAFYDALREGSGGKDENPIFYVSSSPWNIYDVIAEFMDLQKIPKGVLTLRDWDIGLNALSSSVHSEHKMKVIRNIMELYTDLDFVLIGDSGQHDPEVYHQIVTEFPGRVRAIYIRDVTRTRERTAAIEKLATQVVAAHSELVLAENTFAAATHAAEHGLISADALPKIHEEKKADEGTTSEKVATPGGGEPSSSESTTVSG